MPLGNLHSGSVFRQREILYLALAACGAFVVTAVVRYLAIVGFTNDHYEHLAGAQQMLLGEWPTRDFFDPGMPLMYTMSAVAQLVLGPTLFAEAILVVVAFGLAASLTLVAAYRLSRSLPVAIVAAVLCVAIFPRSYGYPKVLLYAAGPLVWWAWMRKPTLARMAGVAVFVFVAFLFRHDHGIYLGVSALVAILLAPSETWRQVLQRMGIFCLAVGVLLVPYLVYIELNGGLLEYLRDGIHYWRREVNRTQLHFGTASGHEARLFFGFYALPLAAVAWVGIDRSRYRVAAPAIVVPLAVMALLVNSGFLRDPLGARLRDAIVPAVLILAWLAGRALRVYTPALRATAVVAVVLVAAFGADAVIAVGNTGEVLERTSLGRTIGRTPHLFVQKTGELVAPFSPRQVPDEGVLRLIPFFDYLERCTPRHYRLLVAAYAPEVFVFAKRPFAGGQRFFIEGYQRREVQRRIIERMDDQVVAFALMPSDSVSAWRREFTELNAFVESNFQPMVDITTRRGTIRVMVNTSLPPVRRDRLTAWPCYQ